MTSALQAMQQLLLETQHFLKSESLLWRHWEKCSYFFELLLKLDDTLPVVFFFKCSSPLAPHKVNRITR